MGSLLLHLRFRLAWSFINQVLLLNLQRGQLSEVALVVQEEMGIPANGLIPAADTQLEMAKVVAIVSIQSSVGKTVLDRLTR